MTKNVNEPHANREKKPALLRNGNPQGDPMNATRCGAMTRKGTPCKAPANHPTQASGFAAGHNIAGY